MTERLPRVAIVLLVAASLVVTLAGLRSTAHIVGPTFLALVLTITVHPVRRAMVRKGLPEWLVSLVVLLSVCFLLLGVTVCMIFALGRLAALLPTYVPDLNDTVAEAGKWFADHGVGADQVQAATGAIDFGNLLSIAGDVFGAAVGVLSDLVFIVMLALFMAFDTGATQRVFGKVRETKPDLVDALASFAKGTRTYMAVSAGFGLIVAVIDGIALELMGVPGAFVWAVLAFVTNFIPNIGFVIGVIPPAIIALLEGGPGLMVAVLAVYCVINLIIQSIIQPRYVGESVGLTPTITMLSLVFWAWALGPLGALLAVPLSLLMRALLVEADPSAAWAMPLISGHTQDELEDAPGPEPVQKPAQTRVEADGAR